MSDEKPVEKESESSPSFNIVGLNYVSLYFKEFEEAVEFYTKAFGNHTYKEGEIYGWPMGSTYLTFFPSRNGTSTDSNPCNTEFAIQVASPTDVDAIYNHLLSLGAKTCMVPEDTWMYEPMRFACVDDPFGIRIDIYSPLPMEK